MQVNEPAVIHDFLNGVIKGDNVSHYIKTYKEIKNIYIDKDINLPDDTVMYEVYSYEPEDNSDNTLLWGLTVMNPVLVNGECNMTRGHFHSNRTQGEIYFGLAGTGLLLMMDDTGHTFAEKVFCGSVHYINGKFAHRLMNTGNDVFKVGACWAKLAGHDYETIEKKPFSQRVYKINDNIKFI